MTFPSVTKRTVALFAASVLLLSDMGGLPSAIANGEVPSLQDAQETVEEETGWDIDWENPIGRSARAGIIRGTSEIGEGVEIAIECIVTYPPLRFRCRFSFEL
ncbi:MAG: hypothetical protein AAB489_05350 [Patescibacteria group bacterium]